MTSFDETTTETDAPEDEAAPADADETTDVADAGTDDDGPAAVAAEPEPAPDDDADGAEAEAEVDPDVLAVLGTPGPVGAPEDDETAGDADVAAFLTGAGSTDTDEAEDEAAEIEDADEAPAVEADVPEADAAEADADGASEDDEVEAEPYDNPWLRPGKWYVVHTQSGYEKKVQQNLQARTQSMNMEDAIYEVVIPMEDVPEFKQGKKVIVQKKVFPGYLLVRCNLTDDSWFVIRNTPGVTGFVGHGNKPTPLPRRDVESFLSVKKEGDDSGPSKRSKPRLEYEINETVRVKEGPFADFSGEIVEINEDQLKVKVLVNIFGRETPVELEFSQVAKL
jgi:transcriptional antiterminator NusG